MVEELSRCWFVVVVVLKLSLGTRHKRCENTEMTHLSSFESRMTKLAYLTQFEHTIRLPGALQGTCSSEAKVYLS